MYVLLSGLDDVGALGAATAIPAGSATDILFGLGQQQITNPDDLATFKKYGRGYISDFVSDFYAAGYMLASNPGSSVNGATLLPIMQKRNSGYWFKLSDDQLLKMSAAIDALPKSGYGFVTTSSLMQQSPLQTQSITESISSALEPASFTLPFAESTPSAPAIAQTPVNAVAAAQTPAESKTPMLLTTLAAANSAINAYAPLMPASAKQFAALQLFNAKKGQTIYVPRFSWMPWIIGGAGIVLFAGMLYLTLRKEKA